MNLTPVPGLGSLAARLVIVGEAPDAHEVHHHPPMPFVGPSGFRLFEWLGEVGLVRDHCYIDNVYPYQPPGNKIDAIPHATLLPHMTALHDRLAALTDPWLIVPLGNYALYALLGLGVVSWHKRDGKRDRPGITAHRGSLYTYTDLRGRRVKVIPSIHPSVTLGKNPTMEGVCRRDWEKIARELQDRTPDLPRRTILSNPAPSDIANFYADAARDPSAMITFDIERPAGQVYVRTTKPMKGHPNGKKLYKKDYRAGKVVCIALTLDPYTRTVVVPMTPTYWNRRPEWAGFDAWGWMRAILALPNPKGTQNGLFDIWHCLDHATPVANWHYDALYLHHAMNPRDKHSLEYMSSVQLRTQYWKDEAKDPDSISGYTEREDEFRVYCGKDSSHTAELIGTFLGRATPEEWDRYLTHYYALYAPLLALMRHGYRVDTKEAARRTTALQDELRTLRTTLHDLTGVNILAAKSISYTALSTYLYRTLKLPEQKKRRGKGGKATATTDEIALKRLSIKYPDVFPKAVSDAILRVRRVQKLLESYDPKHFDPDGRMRSTYSPNTQQGRLSSKKNPRGSGTNAQNVDADARDVFLADEGCVMLIVDLSQAESRVNRCYIHSLTGDPETLWKAYASPTEWDDHSDMTRRIFGVTDPAEVKNNRPLGKMIVHASQRAMQGETLADRILKERGEVVLPETATALIEKAVDAQPGLRDYFRWVEYQVNHTRQVVSCWGVPLRFTYERLGPACYRDAYSFFMQDAVGRLMNQYGVRWLWERDPLNLWQRGVLALNGQLHDGVLFSMPPDPRLIATTLRGLMDSLATPLNLNGVPLAMPSTVKIGLHSGAKFEWKWCPSEEEVEAALATLNVSRMEVPL